MWKFIIILSIFFGLKLLVLVLKIHLISILKDEEQQSYRRYVGNKEMTMMAIISRATGIDRMSSVPVNVI